MQHKKRLEALKKKLGTENIDGLFIIKKENIAYLCGLEGDGSAILVAPGKRDFFITDPRFKQKAEEKLPDFNIRLVDGSRYAVIKDIIKTCKIKRLGFESDWLTYNAYVGLRKNLRKTGLIPKHNLIEELRMIKDKEEIALIKKSARIIKKAYLYAKGFISPRLNGERLAILVDNFMRREGADRPAFQTIVAQNPYSSYPHGPATSVLFGKDSAILIDTGAVFKGYNSDLTRIIFLGRITSRFRRIYNIIKTAQEKALEKIKPGIKISELDRAARQYIANKGLGKHFLHSLGHGIGLEIHELPRLQRKNKMHLKPGMVFTVEPGVYIPGWGGLRLEDMVVVTKNGCEVLTDDIPK